MTYSIITLSFYLKKKKSLDTQQRAAGWIRTQNSSFQPYVVFTLWRGDFVDLGSTAFYSSVNIEQVLLYIYWIYSLLKK